MVDFALMVVALACCGGVLWLHRSSAGLRAKLVVCAAIIFVSVASIAGVVFRAMPN